MKMGFRWYGEGNDTVTLDEIRQIPGVETIVWSLHHKQAGEVWETAEIEAEMAGSRRSPPRRPPTASRKRFDAEVVESVNVHESIKLGKTVLGLSRDEAIENYITTTPAARPSRCEGRLLQLHARLRLAAHRSVAPVARRLDRAVLRESRRGPDVTGETHRRHEGELGWIDAPRMGARTPRRLQRTQRGVRGCHPRGHVQPLPVLPGRDHPDLRRVRRQDGRPPRRSAVRPVRLAPGGVDQEGPGHGAVVERQPVPRADAVPGVVLGQSRAGRRGRRQDLHGPHPLLACAQHQAFSER